MPIYFESEAASRRFCNLVTLTLVTLVVLGLLGYWLGEPKYRRYREERFLAQAQEFIQKGDFPNAALKARLALNLNSNNLEACRIMAQAAEVAGVPEVVTWLQRIVDLEPNVFLNRLALAKAAFVRGDIARARKALDGADEAGRKTAAYHELAGLLAVAGNQYDESEAHLAEAARLDPENKRLQLNLAVLQLQARDQEVAQDARGRLEKLSLDEEFRLQALRVLAGAALRSNDLAGALAHASRLAADPSAKLDDHLLQLTLLARSKSQEFAAFLAALQKDVAAKPDQIYGLAGWMIGQGMADDVLQWLQTLPAETKQQPAVMMAGADAHNGMKDWPALDKLLQERPWGDLEFIRHALQARLALEYRDSAGQETHWLAAVQSAGQRVRALTALVQLANSWRWTKERERLLWMIAPKLPQERWPLVELSRLYHEAGDTRGLNQVFSKMLSRDPTDLTAKNDFATTSLLLKWNLVQAQILAQEAYRLHPEDPVLASTYAYSLHLQGQTAEALKVLRKLKPEQLENPSIAAYYGVFLHLSGETNTARKYLELARQARLLPEEKAMVQEALKGP